MSDKVGLITYHSAYNFGSVLQAYATQEAIKSIAGNCEIINYRSKEQRRVYSIFTWNKEKFYLKSIVRNLLCIMDYGSQRKRALKYEDTMRKLLTLTEECITPDDVYAIWNRYDVVVSGSDQIWNKHSNELEHVGWEYMNPYLLHGYTKKKISYASSVTNMSDVEIQRILPDLNSFDRISVREFSSYKKIEPLVSTSICNVLDPTFLLSSDEWVRKLELKRCDGEPYILFYVLCRRKEMNNLMKTVRKIGENKQIKIKMIAPLNNIKSVQGIEVLKEVEPIEFMELIYNAKSVITDSYHGTILSVNLQKDIYSVCKGFPSDFRKSDILERIGLQNRVIRNIEQLLQEDFQAIDYKHVNAIVDVLRKESKEYLISAIRD